ncbi:hypothetical protein BwSH12_54480 [Bradyrhizobium ottawaense]|nr:hypothetical protein BwSH12_54480 [Bradyrhizobium ottawaense]
MVPGSGATTAPLGPPAGPTAARLQFRTCASRPVVRFVRHSTLFYDEGKTDLPEQLPRYMEASEISQPGYAV